MPTYSGVSQTYNCQFQHNKFIKGETGKHFLCILGTVLLSLMAMGWSCVEWKPFSLMLAIDLAFAIVNILLKKVLDEGMNHLVFITYRLVISAVFLAPIGYFVERYECHLALE